MQSRVQVLNGRNFPVLNKDVKISLIKNNTVKQKFEEYEQV